MEHPRELMFLYQGETTMLKTILRLAALALLLSLAFNGLANAKAARPNILIAISDDHSWNDTSVQGSPFVKTPNVDSIANAGFRFSNAY